METLRAFSRLLLVATVLGGCAAPRTAERPAAHDRDARLCLAEGAPRRGERVRFQRRVCHTGATDRAQATCSLRLIDTAQVVRTVDDHCAIVRVAAGTRLEHGDVLELLPPARM